MDAVKNFMIVAILSTMYVLNMNNDVMFVLDVFVYSAIATICQDIAATALMVVKVPNLIQLNCQHRLNIIFDCCAVLPHTWFSSAHGLLTVFTVVFIS